MLSDISLAERLGGRGRLIALGHGKALELRRIIKTAENFIQSRLPVLKGSLFCTEDCQIIDRIISHPVPMAKGTTSAVNIPSPVVPFCVKSARRMEGEIATLLIP